MLLENGCKIEYVDCRWLHFYRSDGMTSILLGRKRFPKFLQFLFEMLNRTSFNEPNGSLEFNDISFLCEGPDENHFNIFIDNDSSRFIFGIEKYEIQPLINQLSFQYLKELFENVK